MHYYLTTAARETIIYRSVYSLLNHLLIHYESSGQRTRACKDRKREKYERCYIASINWVSSQVFFGFRPIGDGR